MAWLQAVAAAVGWGVAAGRGMRGVGVGMARGVVAAVGVVGVACVKEGEAEGGVVPTPPVRWAWGVWGLHWGMPASGV